MSCATHSEEEAGGGCPVVGQVEFDLEQFFDDFRCRLLIRMVNPYSNRGEELQELRRLERDFLIDYTYPVDLISGCMQKPFIF